MVLGSMELAKLGSQAKQFALGSVAQVGARTHAPWGMHTMHEHQRLSHTRLVHASCTRMHTTGRGEEDGRARVHREELFGVVNRKTYILP